MIATAIRAMILRVGVVLGSKGGFLSCSLWKAEWSEMLIRHTSKVAIDWVHGTTHVEPGDSEWWSLTCSYTNQRALARRHGNQSSLSTTEQQVLHRQMELCSLEIFMLLHSKNYRPCSCRKMSDSGPKCLLHTVVAFSTTHCNILRSGRSFFCPVSAQSLYTFQCDSSLRKT